MSGPIVAYETLPTIENAQIFSDDILPEGLDGLRISLPNLERLTFILNPGLLWGIPVSFTFLGLQGRNVSASVESFYPQCCAAVSSAIAIANASAAYTFPDDEVHVLEPIYSFETPMYYAYLFSIAVWAAVAALEFGNGVGRPCGGSDFGHGSENFSAINTEILQDAYPTQWFGDGAQLYQEKLENQKHYVDIAAKTDSDVKDLIKSQAELVNFGREYLACAQIAAAGLSVLVTQAAPSVAAAIVNPIAAASIMKKFLAMIGIMASALLAAVISGILYIAAEAVYIAERIENVRRGYENIVHEVNKKILSASKSATTQGPCPQIPAMVSGAPSNLFGEVSTQMWAMRNLAPADRIGDQQGERMPSMVGTGISGAAPHTWPGHHERSKTKSPMPAFSREVAFADRPDRLSRQPASWASRGHASGHDGVAIDPEVVYMADTPVFRSAGIPSANQACQLRPAL